MRFAQSAGVKDYSQAKKISGIRSRSEFINELMKNKDVRKNYGKSYEMEEALKKEGLYYKF